VDARSDGGANISYSLAEEGELPSVFEGKVWFGSTEGLYVTAGLAIVFAAFCEMDGIASITSTVFTIIYVFVVVSHLRLADEVDGSRIILVLNLTVLIAVPCALLFFQWRTRPMTLCGAFAVLTGALVLAAILRHAGKRVMKIVHEIERQLSHYPR